MKKVFSFLLILGLFVGLVGCGSSDDSESKTPSEPLDLTGTWISDNGEGTYHEAIITNDTIEINWMGMGDDTKSLYWYGSFTAPTTAEEEYTWTSKTDHAKTDSAMLASQDETKVFTYKDGVISYEASAMGTTKNVKLEKKDK